MSKCTWDKVDGKYVCMAKECIHWTENGCKLGKVSLTCDNNECKWNKEIAPGVYGCYCMDVHLDAKGQCMGMKYETTNLYNRI